MDIILNPMVAQLMGEIKNLKEKLLTLIEERDELLGHICPNLKAKYYELFGTLEYEAVELDKKIREIRRKLEIIREKIAKQEPVIMHEVERQIEDELKEYAEHLLSIRNDIDEAEKRLNSETLSLFDAKELKSIYRKIAKQLHPDLHENLTPEQRELFFKAAEAYHNGDITLMRMLDVATESVEISDKIPEENTIEKLETQRDKLRLNTDTIYELIRQTKNDFPYNIHEMLEDKKQIKEKQDQLRQLIVDYRSVYKEYEKEYLDFFPNE